MIRRHKAALIGLALFSALASVSSANAWQQIMPYHFGRYSAAPSVYGYPLYDEGAGYYGGAFYKQYYAYHRGFGLADFPPPVPEYQHGHWFKHRYWPFGTSRLPTAVDHTLDFASNCLIVVEVPPGAQVWLEGQPTTQTGPVRTFVSPPLAPDQTFVYEVRVSWNGKGGVTEQTKSVPVRSGQEVRLQFPLREATEPIAYTPAFQPVPPPAP
jgi:uncharacterized protein (TIGR03000 family)